MWATLEIAWDGKKISIRDNGGYEKRNESTLRLINSAVEIYLQKQKNPFKLKISTGDKYVPGYFCYSNAENKNLIPDFIFDKWDEVRIFDYEKKVENLLVAANREIVSNKVFWVGNCNTHPIRKSLIENFKNNEKTLFLDSGKWIKTETTKLDGALSATGQFSSLEDHANYKYLLDIRGNGYSGRFKLLLFLNRPVFYVERSDNEYFFYEDLKPFVHYIPVKSDFSDLNEKINWAEAHEEECKNIAKNAQEYAVNNLRRKNAVDYFVKILTSISEKS